MMKHKLKMPVDAAIIRAKARKGGRVRASSKYSAVDRGFDPTPYDADADADAEEGNLYCHI